MRVETFNLDAVFSRQNAISCWWAHTATPLSSV
ncbi:MAG: hypothetical protein AVDCRST_MAG86-3468, partial [uncultured Truepera sp.]